MVKNYFKTAWRNIKRNKGFFALNFAGLYLSILACLLIGMLILHETSFDKPNDKGLNIYRIVKSTEKPTGKVYGPVTPYPLATALRTALLDEGVVSQIHFQKNDVVSFGSNKFKTDNIVFADSVFPRLFPLIVKQGSLQNALAGPGFVLLTETTANKFFGKEPPVGKRIKLANLVDLEVAAVIADAPANTHLPYNMIVSYPSMRPEFIGGFPLRAWSLNASGYTYIALPNPKHIRHVEAALTSLASENLNKKNSGSKTTFHLQPLPDIHYNQLYAEGNPAYTVKHSYLLLIGAIGLFLILAACINYTNLSTALAIKKSKEVGVRKTMGATRRDLIKQFLSETFALTAFVVAAAALSVRFFLPLLNGFLDKNMPLSWLHLNSAVLLFCLWFFVSLSSGLYPAFVLSGFNPIAALKNKTVAPRASVTTLRRGLVAFQFLTAQVLIIGAIVVAKQMDFIQSQPLGFSRAGVVDIGLPDNDAGQPELLRNRLAAVPGIRELSFSLGAPVTENNAFTTFNRKEKYATEKIDVEIKAADKNYLRTYGLRLGAGRWFDNEDEQNIPSSIPDSLKRYAFVLNETAVKALGYSSADEALGKYITFGFYGISAPVIGVVKDFNTASLHDAVKPVLMVELPSFYYNMGIKLGQGYSAATLSAIEKAWTSVYPDRLFETSFLDEQIASLYKTEKRTQQLFNLFAFLSIAINILGLVGLLSFMIEQKTKEIGIRKVLGASVKDISFILSKDFLRLIVLAFFVAAPVAWLLMNQWLQDFAYRTSISWWVFAAAVLSALFVTAIAVGFQTIKAATANPVKSLRTE